MPPEDEWSPGPCKSSFGARFICQRVESKTVTTMAHPIRWRRLDAAVYQAYRPAPLYLDNDTISVRLAQCGMFCEQSRLVAVEISLVLSSTPKEVVIGAESVRYRVHNFERSPVAHIEHQGTEHFYQLESPSTCGRFQYVANQPSSQPYKAPCVNLAR